MVTAYAAEEKRERRTVAEANFMVTGGRVFFLRLVCIGRERGLFKNRRIGL